MQSVVDFLKDAHLHPFVDHFSVALVLVAVLFDLVASLLPSRAWLRYAALTLIILGAAAAAGSKVTGGWEAERVWDTLSGAQKDALRAHAHFGEYLAYALGGVAVWRLGLQFIGFLGKTRAIYLIVAVVGGGAMLYQGDTGGGLVYELGIGTALSGKETPVPAQSPGSSEAATPIPTVFVAPTPAGSISVAPSPVASPAPAAAETSTAPSAAAPATAEPGPAASAAPGSPEPSASASPASKSTTL